MPHGKFRDWRSRRAFAKYERICAAPTVLCPFSRSSQCLCIALGLYRPDGAGLVDGPVAVNLAWAFRCGRSKSSLCRLGAPQLRRNKNTLLERRAVRMRRQARRRIATMARKPQAQTAMSAMRNQFVACWAAEANENVSETGLPEVIGECGEHWTSSRTRERRRQMRQIQKANSKSKFKKQIQTQHRPTKRRVGRYKGQNGAQQAYAPTAQPLRRNSIA